MQHQYAWHSPAPLWPTSLASLEAKVRFQQPRILRFETDTFMEDLIAELQDDPGSLDSRLLRRERWDAPPGPDDPLPAIDEPVKIFQPTHGRYYVAVASLVCQIRGLPDRAVDLPSGETVSFVLRRRQEATEFAWCGPEAGWKEVAADGLLDDEERLNAFPLNFQHELKFAGRTKMQPRRLHAALVPVSSVETYAAGALTLVPDPDDETISNDRLQDARFSEFEAAVYDGLLSLRNAIVHPDSELEPELDLAREIFALSVLDLQLFFEKHLEGRAPGDVSARFDATWEAWLEEAGEQRSAIEDGALAGTDFSSVSTDEMRSAVNELFGLAVGDTIIRDREGLSTELDDAVSEALADFGGAIAYATDDDPTADPNRAPKLATEDLDNTVSYVIRFVYDRPQCRAKFERMVGVDGLAALRETFKSHQRYRPLVSEASQPFTLASFFDSDAPQRPIRITMPVDTSPSGLRKFPRNVAILISDNLRKQMQKAGKELDEIGMGDTTGISIGVICSFSIPIITIVALILLLLFVFILNIIFWWLPFFRICFPLLLPSKKN